MRKIALFIFAYIIFSPAPTGATNPNVGIGLSSIAAQYSRTGIISATAITWSDGVDISWGDGTIIVEN